MPAGRVFTELRCQLREDDQQARCINGTADGWFPRGGAGQSVCLTLRAAKLQERCDRQAHRSNEVPSALVSVSAFRRGTEKAPPKRG